MANKNRGESKIRLDKTRTLRFDFNAFSEFEDRAGKSVIEAIQEFQDEEGNPKVSFRNIHLLLWAGLLHEEPKLTIRGAGDLFEQADGENMMAKMTYVFGAVCSAIFDKFGDTEAKKKLMEAQETLKSGSGTGSSSSESPMASSA